MKDVALYNTPVTLEGKYAHLEPLSLAHADDLFAVGQDAEIWEYMPVPTPRSVGDVCSWIRAALDLQERGAILPFAIVDVATGRAIGSTRYLDISAPDRHIEIGWTWLAREHWRTPVNTECKFLLLQYAFETLGCIRVALKTDLRNKRSQRAIERIGGVREGVLRRVVVMYDGYQRSTVYYSILDDEWADVKNSLQEKMQTA